MDYHSGRTVDKYRLLRQIGRGGMGEVWEAEHTVIGRRCALKIMRHELAQNQEAVHRMLREARATASIGHPNIVDIYDLGTTSEGLSYLVMELLVGESLDEILDRVDRLDLRSSVYLVDQILSALDAVHGKGIVHRDLKPENVFIARTKRGGWEVKLLDFGISKMRETGLDSPKLTQTGAVLGTAYYMSPEQASGSRHVDARADLWSIGVILYEALTGHLPFPGENYNQVIVAIASDTYRIKRPREHRPDIPEPLENLVLRAMSRDVDMRHQSAAEMREELRGVARQLVARTHDARPSPDAAPDVWSGAKPGPTPGDAREVEPRYGPAPEANPEAWNEVMEAQEQAADLLAGTPLSDGADPDPAPYVSEKPRKPSTVERWRIEEPEAGVSEHAPNSEAAQARPGIDEPEMALDMPVPYAEILEDEKGDEDIVRGSQMPPVVIVDVGLSEEAEEDTVPDSQLPPLVIGDEDNAEEVAQEDTEEDSQKHSVIFVTDDLTEKDDDLALALAYTKPPDADTGEELAAVMHPEAGEALLDSSAAESHPSAQESQLRPRKTLSQSTGQIVTKSDTSLSLSLRRPWAVPVALGLIAAAVLAVVIFGILDQRKPDDDSGPPSAVHSAPMQLSRSPASTDTSLTEPRKREVMKQVADVPSSTGSRQLRSKLAVHLMGVPRRARIYLDGVRVRGPLSVSVDSGRHVVEVRTRRRGRFRKVFFARSGSNRIEIQVDLTTPTRASSTRRRRRTSRRSMHTARPRAASVREMHPPSHPSSRPRARTRPKPRRPAMPRRRPGSDGLWNNPF